MTDKTPPRPDRMQGHSRDERLKAALKANMARRKAQARSRKLVQATDSGGKKDNDKD